MEWVSLNLLYEIIHLLPKLDNTIAFRQCTIWNKIPAWTGHMVYKKNATPFIFIFYGLTLSPALTNPSSSSQTVKVCERIHHSIMY